MSFAAAFLLVAAAATTASPAPDNAQHGQGAQVASAQVSVKILRPVMLKDGQIATAEAPHSQVLRRTGQITYEFE